MPRAAVIALSLLALLPTTGLADTSVTVYSDAGDFIGEGRPWFFGPDARVSSERDGLVAGDNVGIGVSGGGSGWSFVFAAPRGQELVPGNYLWAQRAPFAADGHPGLEVGAESRGCNTVYGRFELRDLVRRDDGTVRRAWILFQQHCDGRLPAAWGELRINLPDAATSPTVVRWSDLDWWHERTTVPVRYEGAAPLASVTLTGAHTQDFRVADSGCRSTPCEVTVAFEPAAAGARTATLRFTDAAGGTHDVALEAFLNGGTSRLVTEELWVDPYYQREPRSYGFELPGARFNGHLHGPPAHAEVLVYAERPDGTRYQGRFRPGPEGWRTDHAYTNVRAGWNVPDGPAMDIDGPSGCVATDGGSFTVEEMTLNGEGGLRTFDIAFEEMCADGDQRRPGLRGRWQYRAGDANPLPAWLLPGPRPGLGVMPPEPPPATPPGTAPPTPPAATAPTAPTALTLAAGRRAASACARRALRRIAGTARRDALRGGARPDRLLGRGGPDRLNGRGGGDCLHGGAGNDRLQGGAGRDALFGGPGDDLLAGGADADIIDCGRGRRDRAVAGPGDRTRGCERIVRAARLP